MLLTHISAPNVDKLDSRITFPIHNGVFLVLSSILSDYRKKGNIFRVYKTQRSTSYRTF